MASLRADFYGKKKNRKDNKTEFMNKALFLALLFILTHLIVSQRILSPLNKVAIGGRAIENADHVSFDWSGVDMNVHFTGVKHPPAVVLQDIGAHYNVFLHKVGKELELACKEVLITKKGVKTAYPLCANTELDPTKEYFMTVEKRTEASFGVSKFFGFEFGKNVEILPKPDLNIQRKRIEFIGDSITCGYGNEGTFPCHFSGTTENVHLSWVSVAARKLNYEYRVACWSGKGMVRNYGYKQTKSPDPLPHFYFRTLATDSKTEWDFNKWVPDIVVISLGANDFSTPPRPSYAEFSQGYHQFMDKIKHKYASKKLKFYLVCVPGVANCEYQKKIAEERKKQGDHAEYISMSNVFSNKKCHNNGCSGCDWHPNVVGDQLMANYLVEQIEKN